MKGINQTARALGASSTLARRGARGSRSAAGAAAVTATFGPTPYLSVADSPFAGLGLTGFQLEDFEDGVLNVPGVAATTGGTVIGPQPQADSVDGDAGGIDGSGADGRSMLSIPSTNVLTFEFDAAVARRICRRMRVSCGRTSGT